MRHWRRRAAQAAFLALLLQLALPFLTVHRATAGPGLDTPFVICTGAGLVWLDPDGTAAGGGAPEDPETAHHCPVCFIKQLASAAVVPAPPPLRVPEPGGAAGLEAPQTAPSFAPSAPPLPPRGPPSVG